MQKGNKTQSTDVSGAWFPIIGKPEIGGLMFEPLLRKSGGLISKRCKNRGKKRKYLWPSQELTLPGGTTSPGPQKGCR